MRKLIFFLLSILMTLHVHGIGDVTIKGYFPGAEGETIHLMTYEDLISRHQLRLSSAKIDDNGNFEFATSINESRLLFFRVFNGKNYLYAAPGESYQVEYEKLVINNPEHDESRLFRQRSFNVTIRGIDNRGDDLHGLIMQMDDMVATFLEDEVAGRIRTSHRASMEQFKQQVNAVFGGDLNPFMEDYVTYYLAYLKRSLNVRGFNALFHHYVKDLPILTNHPLYVDFFRSMFDNYVFSGSRSIRMHQLETAVNEYADFEKFMELLAQDELLQDDALRELVLLISIDRMFAMPDFLNSRLRLILEQASKKSRVPEHRIIAANIIRKHSRGFHEGAIAADFQMSDAAGNVVDLQSFRDSHVYLFFWAGWCPLSMQSVSSMETIAEEFDEQLEVVGVLVDRNRKEVSNLLDDPELPFQLLYFDDDYELLENFGVATVPFYILIGPGGRIIAHPFVPPHWGAGEALQQKLHR